jgi:hypothetical protein
MSFQKVLERLEAIPEHQRKLASGQYVWRSRDPETGEIVNDCGCVLGKVMPLIYNHPLLENINYSNLWSLMVHTNPEVWQPVVQDMNDLDISYDELVALQNENDRFCTNKEVSTDNNESPANDEDVRRKRFTYVVEWLKRAIADPSLAPELGHGSTLVKLSEERGFRLSPANPA